jgi:hypothetical protein
MIICPPNEKKDILSITYTKQNKIVKDGVSK